MTTRRAMLAGSAIAAVLSPAAALAAPSPDAELIALCADLAATWQAIDAGQAQMAAADPDAAQAIFDRLDAAGGAFPTEYRLASELAATPALTAAGRAAKVRAAWTLMCRNGDAVGSRDYDAVLAMSALDDLMAGGGVPT